MGNQFSCVELEPLEIIKLYTTTDMTIAGIARQFHCKNKRVAKIIDDAGVKDHRGKQAVSIKAAFASESEDVKQLRLAKMTKTQNLLDRRKKMSSLLKERLQNPEFVAKKNEGHARWWATDPKIHLGYKLTPEQRQRLSDAHIGINAGEKHHRWRGGKSLEPYGIGWTAARRRNARNRDHRMCQLCLKKPPQLDVHHIDYDKKNNTPDNWICLCHRCHAQMTAKSNLGFYQELFTSLRQINKYPLLTAGEGGIVYGFKQAG